MLQTSPDIAIMEWAKAWLKKSLWFLSHATMRTDIVGFFSFCVYARQQFCGENENVLHFAFDCCSAFWTDYISLYTQSDLRGSREIRFFCLRTLERMELFFLKESPYSPFSEGCYMFDQLYFWGYVICWCYDFNGIHCKLLHGQQ